jgi:hypothetical protein
VDSSLVVYSAAETVAKEMGPDLEEVGREASGDQSEIDNNPIECGTPLRHPATTNPELD